MVDQHSGIYQETNGTGALMSHRCLPPTLSKMNAITVQNKCRHRYSFIRPQTQILPVGVGSPSTRGACGRPRSRTGPGTSMFGTPSNHSSMFRCASSHDAMRWSGVAWAKINPEYGSTATNTCAFMRRPVTGSGRMRAVAGPVAGHLVARHVLQTRGHVQLRRARGEHARGTPDSHGPSAPPAPAESRYSYHNSFNGSLRYAPLRSTHASRSGCRYPSARSRGLAGNQRSATSRSLRGRQQGGIHRTLPDDPGGTRHITLATMRGTCRPRLRPPPSTASSSPVSNARPSSASFQ